LSFSLRDWRIVMVVLVPGAIALKFANASPVAVFAAASLAIIPLASLLGEATEVLAAQVGPVRGGFLNATLGNATELIIGAVALWRGETEVVKASITGSIIGNLLLVFGLAVFLGGLGREKQEFSRLAVGTNTSMLFLAVVALVMPAVFQWAVFGTLQQTGATIERLSLWTAAVLLVSYFAGLVFTFQTHRKIVAAEGRRSPRVRQGTAIVILVTAAVLIALLSELLVGEIQFVTRSLGWTKLFVGIVIVAIVGNAAEHSTAVIMARKDKMDLALSIAVGSSTQIALFVAPLLILVSQFLPFPMSLVFHPLEITAVILSVGVVTLVAHDGESNWFEGLQLLGVYAILAVFFYVLPMPHER
jgi:Ca2+:H+ antiporter